MIQFVLCKHRDAVRVQKLHGYTVAGNLVARKRAIVNESLAAGRTFRLHYGKIHVVQLRKVQRRLCAFCVLLRHVLACTGDHLVTLPLRRVAGCGQAAHLLGTYADDRVAFCKLNERIALAAVALTQFFIARHFDKEHPHVHIAFNRIDNNGNTISDRHERLRSTRICKELTLIYGLHMANGKENVKRNRLKEPDKTKYELYDILKTEVGICGNWGVLVANLKRQGVEVHFSHRGQTDEIQGVVFTKNGYHFNGSKVDRRFSYSKIDAALQSNRCRERKGMMTNEYEVATPSTPSSIAQSEFFNGSLGLLNGSDSSCNAADVEANQEMAEILRRKKKRKRGMRL